MTPPLDLDGDRLVPQLTARLTAWQQRQAFDTAKDCERARAQIVTKGDEILSRALTARVDQPVLARAVVDQDARCVPAEAIYPQKPSDRK